MRSQHKNVWNSIQGRKNIDCSELRMTSHIHGTPLISALRTIRHWSDSDRKYVQWLLNNGADPGAKAPCVCQPMRSHGNTATDGMSAREVAENMVCSGNEEWIRNVGGIFIAVLEMQPVSTTTYQEEDTSEVRSTTSTTTSRCFLDCLKAIPQYYRCLGDYMTKTDMARARLCCKAFKTVVEKAFHKAAAQASRHRATNSRRIKFDDVHDVYQWATFAKRYTLHSVDMDPEFQRHWGVPDVVVMTDESDESEKQHWSDIADFKFPNERWLRTASSKFFGTPVIELFRVLASDDNINDWLVEGLTRDLLIKGGDPYSKAPAGCLNLVVKGQIIPMSGKSAVERVRS